MKERFIGNPKLDEPVLMGAIMRNSPVRWSWAFKIIVQSAAGVTLAPAYGIICVAVQWRSIVRREVRWRLIRTQALHWTAALLAMYLVFMTSVNRIMNSDANALTVLAVLALATFTAGIHAEAWRICVVGAVLGLAIPAIAWLETSTVLILLVLALLIVVAVFIFLHVPPSFARHAGPPSP